MINHAQDDEYLSIYIYTQINIMPVCVDLTQEKKGSQENKLINQRQQSDQMDEDELNIKLMVASLMNSIN